MKIIYNNIIPFKGFLAINLFGVLFVRGNKNNIKISQNIINHESIHTAQIKEMFYILFYIAYFFEWMFRICQYGPNKKAYRNISFEKEAYDNEKNYEYLTTRKRFAMWRNK